jgi:hypothetical protein
MNIGGTMSKALHCSADLGIPAGFGRIENRHPDRCRYSSRACLSDPDTSQIAEYSWWKGRYRQESGAGRRGPRYTAM